MHLLPREPVMMNVLRWLHQRIIIPGCLLCTTPSSTLLHIRHISHLKTTATAICSIIKCRWGFSSGIHKNTHYFPLISIRKIATTSLIYFYPCVIYWKVTSTLSLIIIHHTISLLMISQIIKYRILPVLQGGFHRLPPEFPTKNESCYQKTTNHLSKTTNRSHKPLYFTSGGDERQEVREKGTLLFSNVSITLLFVTQSEASRPAPTTHTAVGPGGCGRLAAPHYSPDKSWRPRSSFVQHRPTMTHCARSRKIPTNCYSQKGMRKDVWRTRRRDGGGAEYWRLPTGGRWPGGQGMMTDTLSRTRLPITGRAALSCHPGLNKSPSETSITNSSPPS